MTNSKAKDRNKNAQRPSTVHGRNFPPPLGDSIEASARVEVIHAIEASDHVDVEADDGGAVVRDSTCGVHFINLEKGDWINVV